MEDYLRIVRRILNEGQLKSNRTGIGTQFLVGEKIEHDLRDGFPALTTKKIAFKTMLVELEGFIQGITDKAWYQKRGCRIWNQWASPTKILEQNPNVRKQKQLEEMDLGPIYGSQWRNFGGYSNPGKGVDQLQNIISLLKSDPSSRRLLVNAWNPVDLPHMALPPCHVLFHLTTHDGILHLTWFQRSCDVMLGLPFNLSSYGTLLHLLALESGLIAGKVVGLLSDVHIYENHLSQAKEQIERKPYKLPSIETTDFTNIFDWNHQNTQLKNYQHHPKISMDVAI